MGDVFNEDDFSKRAAKARQEWTKSGASKKAIDAFIGLARELEEKQASLRMVKRCFACKVELDGENMSRVDSRYCRSCGMIFGG